MSQSVSQSAKQAVDQELLFYPKQLDSDSLREVSLSRKKAEKNKKTVNRKEEGESNERTLNAVSLHCNNNHFLEDCRRHISYSLLTILHFLPWRRKRPFKARHAWEMSVKKTRSRPAQLLRLLEMLSDEMPWFGFPVCLLVKCIFMDGSDRHLAHVRDHTRVLPLGRWLLAKLHL